jgi:hypothetical protein
MTSGVITVAGVQLDTATGVGRGDANRQHYVS